MSHANPMNLKPMGLPRPDLDREDTPPRQSEGRRIWNQLKRSRLAIPGGIVVLLFILVALLAPLIAPHDPIKNNLIKPLQAPGPSHLLGTDELGRDILSRIIYGARLSLVEGLISVLLAMAIGVPLGVLSGFIGGKTDTILMRFVDILMAFPGVLLAVAIISVLGPSLVNAMISVGVYTIPMFARLARGSTLSVKEEPYIEACRAVGMNPFRILYRHVFPNIRAHLFVMGTLRVGTAILTASSLSFLGLGAQPPSPEWGAMLSNGRNYILVAPHLVIFPGLAIILLVLGLNLLQDGLRLALDPKMTER
jgi:ABC-type dipeptide/oligopeptide/nickel transport system permease subunit